MASNVDIKLMAGLDIDSSIPQIKDDIAQIQKKLEAAGIKINLVAEIDEQLKNSLKKLSNNKDVTTSGKQLGENLAASLINGYNIKSKDAQRQIKNLTRSIFQMSFDEIKTGKDNPEFLNTFNQLGEAIKNNANIIKERMGIYDDFYEYFQGLGKIKIPDIVQQDLGKDWDSMRKVAARKFVTNKSGIELDSIYQEMSDKYKDIFTGTTDPTEQFREIINAVKAYRADVGQLEPVDPSKITGFEDNMWSDLLSDIGILREQIKAQLPQIEEEVKASAQNIKKSLMDIDVSFDSTGVEQLTEKVKGYFTSLDGISDENVKLQFFKNGNEDITSFNATIDKGRGIIEKYNFALNNMGQYVYSGGSIIDTTGKEFTELTAKASEYQQKLELLKTTYKDFLSGDSANNPFKKLVDSIDFSNITDRNSLDEMVAKLKQATEQAKTFNAEITKKWSSNAAEKLEQYIKELPSDLDYLEAKFKGANIKMPDSIAQSFANMRKEIVEINNTQDPQQKIQAYNRLTSELNNVTKQYKQLSIEQKNAEKDSKLQSNKNLFSTNIDTWMNKNTAAAKVFSEQLSDIKTKLSTADAVEFTHLKSEFQNIQAEAKQMGLTTSGVMKEIKEGFNSAVTNVVSFTAAMSTFRKMVDTAKDIDDSMYNIQIVTGQTREEAKNLMDVYNQMAQDLGATTTQISSAADDWLRSGKSISETNTLIKDSLILAKIGMIDTATATKDLMSIMNGFQLDVSHAIEIMSKLGSIDQASASSAGGLAESLSRTASSAKQAGINLDMLLGMLATIKDTAPNIGDEQIGNSIKAIVARYSQIKVGKFEDYESGESLSNVEKALNKVGIKLRENLTDYRDLSDVLKELAGKYNTLNDVERNSINTALFGTYQANMGQILLSNWDKVEKLTEISEKSSTEALDKFNKYADSVTAHVNSMKAAYEKLAMQLADSEFLKGAADAGTGFLNVLSEIIDKLGVMSTAMGAITAGAALKGHTLGVFDNNGTDITFLGKTLEEMKQASAEGQKFGGLFTSNVIQPISNAQSVIDNYNKLVANQCVNQNRINRLTDDLDMRKYLSGLNGAEAGMKGYTASLNMGTAATMGLKVATVALNMAFNMAIMAAVTASVSFLVNKYKELNPTVEEATSALEENQNELQQHTDKVEELGSQLKEAQDKLEKLNGVGGIKSLTDQEEVDRLKNVTEELKTQLAVEKERQALKARETLDSADKAYKSYDQLYTSDGSVIGGKEEAMAYGSSNPAQEMEYTIAAYKRVQDEYDRITAEIANGGNTDKLTQEQSKLSTELNNIRNNALALYDVINKVNGAEASITDAGQELSEVEKEQFKETERGVGLYADFLKYFKTTSTYTDKASDSVDTYSDEAEQAAQAQEDLNAALKKTPEGKQIAAINEMSTGFEKIDKIMKDVKDKGTFDYSNLADTNFTKAFSGMDSYDNFIKTISTYPSDLGKCQDAFNDLVTDFLNSSSIIDNLTDDTADLTTAMLSNMGVSNAEELVTEALAAKHAQLAAQKYIDANATNDLKDATLDEYTQLLNEASSADVSKTALAQLELAKLAVNNAKIDTASDIDQVIALANAAGASATALAKLQRAKAIYDKAESKQGLSGSVGDLRMLEAADRDTSAIEAGTFDFDFQELDASKFKTAIYDGGVKTNTPSKSGPKNSGNSKDPTQFDWIERKITLIDKQVDRLKTKIGTLVGYKNKNVATDTVIDLLNDKLTTLQKSTERYQEELSKIDIPHEYIDKIQNGAFDVDTIAPSDEALAKKIKNYQDLYDKMVDCNDQITETTASIKELNLSKLDNIIDQYSKMSDIQSQILDTEKSLLDLREKQGDKIFASDYTPLIERQLSLSKEYADAYSALAAEMSKMNLKVGTDEWKKYNDQLQDYKNNMISAASAVEDYKDTMTELVYKELTDFKSQMDSLNNSISTMTDLIGSTDLVDDAGNLTDRGIAQVALYAKQLANAKQEAAEYAEAIKSLDDALNSGLITQDEYNSMVSEYTSAQESAVKANKEARDSILSLVKDGIQAEIDAKKELIDQTKAALEAEQDLHEYQESIAEKSSNIAKLERQIATLSGSTDRKDLKQKLELQNQLAEAQKDLYNTQYDHEMEQRKQALDDEYDAFEESKNKESDELDTNLDKQNAAIKDYLDKVKANYSTVYDVLQQYGDEYSLAAIDSLTEPWDSSSEAANVCADAIGDVTANIQYEIDSLDFSSLYELVDLLNQIGAGTYSGSGSYGGDFEDITGTGKWQQGKGGRWWYGEDYNENGDYEYASGGIYTIKGKQYGFDDEGYMITGWNDDSGEWRYFEPENGEMVRDSWRESNGKWYYLGSDGAMARDTTVKAMDGSGYYYIGDDGAWDGKDADAMDNLFYQKLKGKKVGYRNGTQNATPGWHEVNEDGREVLITNDGMLMKMEPGDGVFTKEQTDRLFEILSDPSVMTRGITAFNMKPNTDYAPAPVSQSIEVNMNVGGVVDEAALRVLNEQFPAMIKSNRKLITDQVGKGVTRQLGGKHLSSHIIRF